MTDWQRTIDLKTIWKSKDLPLIAKSIAGQLRGMSPLSDPEADDARLELASDFESLLTSSCSYDDFNEVMERLYDWGDTPLDTVFLGGKKVCWVSTF